MSVVIVGAGPAGCALATALGERAVVLDDGRCSRRPSETIPPGLHRQLSAFSPDGLRPAYGTRACWGSPMPHHHAFLAHAEGHGWRVDRAAFDASLRARAAAAGAVIGPGLVNIDGDPGRWRLRLTDGAVLHARVVVDASGRRAHVARRLAQPPIRVDRARAVVTRWQLPGAVRDPSPLIEATPWGWWYSAGDDDGLWTFALSDTDLPGPTAPHPSADEAPHTAARVAGAVAAAPHTLDAHSQHLPSAVGPGWLAIGDAALTPDPLSSQGLAHALRDADAAAEAVHALLDGEVPSAWTRRHARAVAAHTTARRDLHLRETRWSDHPWWCRRHRRLTLDPLQRVVATGATPRALHLPDHAVAALLARASVPTPAHALLPLTAGEDGILALQDLLDLGALRAA